MNENKLYMVDFIPKKAGTTFTLKVEAIDREIAVMTANNKLRYWLGENPNSFKKPKVREVRA